MADDSRPADRLAELRARIDALDARLVALINERGAVAAEIGRIKAVDGTPIYAPDREKEILERLSRLNAGPFADDVLRNVYRELMSGSFVLERRLRIACLGPRGSFSHLAATRKFGSAVEYEPVTDIAAAFNEVERDHADFAVVPVENSIGGGIIDTLEAFIDSRVRVCAEIALRIQHNFLSRFPLEEVERVYSKPEVFEQCRTWLTQTGLAGRTVAASSSSKAAEIASREAGAAAIGSTLAAELYGLPVLFDHVEDHAHNVTRFFVLGKEIGRPTGDDKTALMFTTSHRAGALVEVLDALRAARVNLTMITSRPSRRRNWEYYFFVDAEGHVDDHGLRSAIEEARRHCLHLVVLGSFPRATEVS